MFIKEQFSVHCFYLQQALNKLFPIITYIWEAICNEHFIMNSIIIVISIALKTALLLCGMIFSGKKYWLHIFFRNFCPSWHDCIMWFLQIFRCLLKLLFCWIQIRCFRRPLKKNKLIVNFLRNKFKMTSCFEIMCYHAKCSYWRMGMHMGQWWHELLRQLVINLEISRSGLPAGHCWGI